MDEGLLEARLGDGQVRDRVAGVEQLSRGAARIEPGNGLTGMRERVRAMGGVLEVDGSDGFRVRVTLP